MELGTRNRPASSFTLVPETPFSNQSDSSFAARRDTRLGDARSWRATCSRRSLVAAAAGPSFDELLLEVMSEDGRSGGDGAFGVLPTGTGVIGGVEEVQHGRGGVRVERAGRGVAGWVLDG